MAEKKQLGDLLVEAEIISVKTLERALERQKGSGKRLGMILEEMGVINEEELVDALAKQFNFRTVKSFSEFSFTQEILQLVPADIAIHKLVFPLKLKDSMLAVAVADPFDNDTLEYLAKKNGIKVIPVLATRREILAAVTKHYLKGTAKEDSRPKVLVVEDSPPIATIIQVALEKEGYQVILAKDGLDGLKAATVEKPDLVICDAVMPRMDGYGLLRALKNNASTGNIPVILLTSKATGEEEQRALDAGFLDFMAKPVQPVRIVSRVKRAFDLIKMYKSTQP